MKLNNYGQQWMKMYVLVNFTILNYLSVLFSDMLFLSFRWFNKNALKSSSKAKKADTLDLVEDHMLSRALLLQDFQLK